MIDRANEQLLKEERWRERLFRSAHCSPQHECAISENAGLTRGYRRFGKKVFLTALLAVFAYSFIARFVVYNLGATHPIIYETPFLRPESVLTGMALYILRPKWHWSFSAVGAFLAGAAFLSLPPPWASQAASAFSYPLAALMFAFIVDAGLRAPSLSGLLSSAPLRYLGRISYGLYVYHYALIVCSVHRVMEIEGRPISPGADAGDYWLLWFAALAFTVIAATVSYYAFELWISRYKRCGRRPHRQAFAFFSAFSASFTTAFRTMICFDRLYRGHCVLVRQLADRLVEQAHFLFG